MKNKNKIGVMNALENCRNYKIIQEIESILHFQENLNVIYIFLFSILFLILYVHTDQCLAETFIYLYKNFNKLYLKQPI